MNNPNDRNSEENKSEIHEKGINMSSLCRTLARVLVNLEEGEYTGNMRQDTVLEHDVLPNPASGEAPARLAE